MASANDRQFRQKYKGKSTLHAQFPQQHIASFKTANIDCSVEDEILAKVSIYHGNIVDDELIEDMDAVVNPANERLWADGSGVCDAIFRKAGYNKLQKGCTTITDKCDDNRIPTGQTVITNGFDLNVTYILHTIAPCEQNNEDLISCYISALELCIIKNIRSVAFPCIGTGDGNFSKTAACSIALRSVRGWLSDAANVKYKDFMKKVDKNNDDEEEEEENKNDDSIYIDDEETVYERITNVVFCCFDQENWELYKDIITKIYPCSNNKHSYLWIERVRSIELENEITNMLQHIQCLEIENKQLKSGEYNNNKHNNNNNNNIEKIYNDLNEKKEEFKQKYSEQEISEILEKCPQKLLKMNCDIIKTLNHLKKTKEITDGFIEYAENINLFISSSIRPNTKRYKEWNVDDIILWIMSIENGKFAGYIDQLKDGLISSEIKCGETLPELTRSDLSVPPFNINSFKIKKELIAHFQSLKTGDVNNEKNEGDNTTNI